MDSLVVFVKQISLQMDCHTTNCAVILVSGKLFGFEKKYLPMYQSVMKYARVYDFYAINYLMYLK